MIRLGGGPARVEYGKRSPGDLITRHASRIEGRNAEGFIKPTGDSKPFFLEQMSRRRQVVDEFLNPGEGDQKRWGRSSQSEENDRDGYSITDTGTVISQHPASSSQFLMAHQNSRGRLQDSRHGLSLASEW